MKIACIGTRLLSKISDEKRQQEYFRLCNSYSSKDFELNTGAADGADATAFNVWINSENYNVNIYLPWKGYNKDLFYKVEDQINIVVLDSNKHKTAMESVEKHHPKPEILTSGARKLMARNYLIIANADVVLAIPEKPIDKDADLTNIFGGTIQGIRIARDLNKELIVV